MAVKTRKQGNSITITIPSEFNIPSGVHYDAKLLPSGEIVFTPEKAETTIIKGSVCFFTICTTRCKFSTEPTEEPPNLISNIYIV